MHTPPRTRRPARSLLALLLAAGLLAALLLVPTAPARAQQQDAADRAEQRMEQLRRQRQAEMRERMRQRQQELQEEIRRNAEPPAPGGVIEQDSLALVALYNSTDGPNWTSNSGWLSAPVADWEGVTVSGDRVVEVYLPSNHLTGEIPAELAQLDNLQGLGLSDNQLTGEIPAELAQLDNLQDLDLPSNHLNGEIPAELAQLDNLQDLDLSFNHLLGEIPAELAQLDNLQDLDLSFNHLSGEIPAELGQLGNLEELYLNSNYSLTGSIPLSFTNLTAMSDAEDGRFYFDVTNLCEPPDAAFQAWLSSVNDVQSTGETCSGGSGPAITSVEPDPVVGSDSPQPLTIHGSGFEQDANVTLRDLTNGGVFANRDISSFSPTEIVINPTFTTEAATWSVEVINPGGESTGEYQFEVVESDPPTQAGDFAYPVGSTGYVTEANDGDGWYNAQDFGVPNPAFGNKLHLGEDWNAESGGNTDCGDPVYATASGAIVYAGNAGSSLGNVVVVRHQLPDGSELESVYMHLASIARTSGTVEYREEIGAIGDADGYYPSCHLHFAIRLPSSPDWGEPGPGYANSTNGWTDPSDFVDSHSSGEAPYTVSISADRITPLTIPSYTGNIPPQDSIEREAFFSALQDIQFSQDKVAARVRVELKEGSIQPVTDVEVQATYKGTPMDIQLNEKVDSDGDGLIDQIPLDANGTQDIPFADVLAVSPSDYSSGTQGTLTTTASTSADSAMSSTTLSLKYAQLSTDGRPFSVTRDGYYFGNPTVKSWREFFSVFVGIPISQIIRGAWVTYLKLYLGRCYGMSGTAGLYFTDPSTKPFSGDPYDPSVEAEDLAVLRPITRYHLAQRRTDLEGRLDVPDVDSEFENAKSEITSGRPVVLGIEAPAGRHALLATKLTQLLDQDIASFTVYDSNHPGVALEAQYDLQDQALQYRSYDGLDWRNIFVSADLSAELLEAGGYESFEDNIEDAIGDTKAFITSITGTDGSSRFAGGSNRTSNPASKYVNALVENSQGQRAGYLSDGTLVNQIPGAEVERIAAGEVSTDSLTAVYVPEEGEYNLSINTSDAGLVGLEHYAPDANGIPNVASADSIGFSENTVATYDETDPSGNVMVDYDGDGTVDETFPTEETVLPVELTSFEAATQEAGVLLTWKTASETGNDGFAIERQSGESGAWTRVGFREGAGTTTEAQSYRFEDANLPYEAGRFTYRLKQVDLDGNARYSEPVSVELAAPEQFALHGSFPNPFGEKTTIRYELPRATDVRLSVYDVLGRRVAVLVNEKQEAGRKEIPFAAEDLASGTYFYRLEAGGQVLTETMVLVR